MKNRAAHSHLSILTRSMVLFSQLNGSRELRGGQGNRDPRLHDPDTPVDPTQTTAAIRKDGQDVATLSTAPAPYNFQLRQQFWVLARPVKGLFSGTVASVPDDHWKNAWTLTRSAYPTADDGIVWHVRDEFDASIIDINTESGRSALWQAFTDAQPKKGARRIQKG